MSNTVEHHLNPQFKEQFLFVVKTRSSTVKHGQEWLHTPDVKQALKEASFNEKDELRLVHFQIVPIKINELGETPEHEIWLHIERIKRHTEVKPSKPLDLSEVVTIY